jgi:hypothetical protein
VRRGQQRQQQAAKPRLTAMQKHEKLVAYLRTLTPEQRAHFHEHPQYLALSEEAQEKFDAALDELSAEEFRAGRSTEELVDEAGIEADLDEDFDLAGDVYGGEVDSAYADDVYALDSLSAEEEIPE